MDFLKSLERKAGTVIYYRGDSIYRSNKIKNLEVYNSSTDVDKNIFAFSAEITGSRGENYKTILYTDTKKVIHSICSCPYFTENNKICKHIVALGLKAHYGMSEGGIKPPEPIKIFEVEKNVVEKKKEIIELQDNSKVLKIFERYEIKLQNIINLNATLQMKYSDIHRKKPIGLTLNLEVESKDKKYKLNSKLDKFLECYEKEKLIFGKAYTYNPDTDYFEGNSKELMNLLMGYYNTLNDSYYYSNFNLETFMKNGYMFDKLVDVLSLSGSIFLEKVELKDILSANISQNMNDKLEIDFTNIKNLMKYGNSTLLNLSALQELDKKIFYRLSSGDMKLYEKILKEKKRKEKIILDLEHLSFAINSIQKIAKIGVSKKLSTKVYKPEKIEDKIFIDCYGSYGLKIRSERIYDGKLESELEGFVILEEKKRENPLLREVLTKYNNSYENGAYHLSDIDEIYKFVMSELKVLEKEYKIYYSEDFKSKKYSEASYTVKTDVKDLLEINFNINGISSEEIAQFLNSVREKRKYFLLKNGGILSIEDRSEFDKLNELIDISEATKKEIESGIILRAKNYSYFLSSALQKIKNVIYDDNFKNMQKDLMSITGKKEEKKIKNLFPILRDYQLYGVQWLLTLKKLGLGGVLADDMGLGKTLQTIAYLSLEERKLPSLIVAPKSLVYNWKSEFLKFSSHLEVKMCIGTKSEREAMIKELKAGEILITTYGVLKNDIELYKNLSFEDGFSNIIIDEAQNIKNILGKTSNAIKEIKGLTKIALTGTPIENNILELWSIFDFAFPGYLGKHTTFKNRYVDNLKSLKNVVSPFILRRLKLDVLKELPEKIEQDIVVDLSSSQKKVYLAYLEKYKKELEDEKSNALDMLSCLMRLRQICNHPKLFIEDYKGDSGKLDALLELLHEAKSGGHRVLLFSQFTEMLSLIKNSIEGEFQYLYLDGKTEVKDRLNLVDRFNSGEGDVFVISLKAGGSGLNLTGADTVIHFDPWWNPSVENQATDRAHRMGQEKSVNVFRIITRGTIEEKINIIKGEKSKIISEVLDGEQHELLKMNREELLKLF